MTDEHKEAVRRHFGASADAYVASRTHAEGEDLARLIELAAATGKEAALDVATGGGHTALALAPHVRRVVATDLSERMLGRAAEFIRGRGARNVEYCVADAEALPFAEASFDLVTCRIAPHHFPDAGRFVREVGRVLRPGGAFLLEDTLVPEDAELSGFIEEVERRRDPTHVRAYSLSEWGAWLEAAGLHLARHEVWRKRHAFDDWTERTRMASEAKADLVRFIAAAPSRAREHFAFTLVDGHPEGYTDEKVILRAEKPAGDA